MFSKKQYFLLFLFFMLPSQIFANIFINNSWKNLSESPNTIIYKEKNVEFTGNNKDDIYINGAKKSKKSWNITKYKSIEFKFKYTEEYIFMISINTEKGQRTLMYLPKKTNTKTYIGLGSDTTNGKWQTIQRNLEEDLQLSESNNHILSINAFICKGKGQVSSIRLFSNTVVNQEWKEISNLTKTISKTYDKEEKINLLQFHNSTGKESYVYRFPKNKVSNTQLEWKFKYKKDYVILISLFTKKGYKNLIYTSKNNSTSNYIGLGDKTQKNKWNIIKRDLVADLKQLDPKNELLYLNAFIYRGEGKLAHIKTLKNKNKASLNKELLSTILAKVLALKKEKPTCNKPSIKLLGKETITIPLKSDYIEEGVVAEDCHGNTMDIEMIGEINLQKKGTNVLHYIATDTMGNVITTSRVIIVGKKTNVPVEPFKPISKKEPIEKEPMEREPYEDIQSDGVDEEYEFIKDAIEAKLDQDYEIGQEIIFE